MQRNNGYMIILSSSYVSFESSASITYFQNIHLPVCHLPVCVYWIQVDSCILYPKLLLVTHDEIKNPHTEIYNKSLQEGSVPNDWTLENLIPLHKRAPNRRQKTINNLRPHK